MPHHRDAVLECCKQLADRRTMEDIRAAIAVLRAEPKCSGEMMAALLEEEPTFAPRSDCDEETRHAEYPHLPRSAAGALPADTVKSASDNSSSPKRHECDNPGCKNEEVGKHPFPLSCRKCDNMRFCSQACHRAVFVQRIRARKQLSLGKAENSMRGQPRALSSSDAAQPAMSSQVGQKDDNDFTCADDRLKYFLSKASVMHVKPGHRVVAAGSMGAAGNRFFIVWRGSLSLQVCKTDKRVSGPEESTLSFCDSSNTLNAADAVTCEEKQDRRRGPDRLVRMKSGPGGPAWESKHIQLSDAEARLHKFQAMVDKRRYGEPFMTDAQKEESFHKKHATEIKMNPEIFTSLPEADPYERIAGQVQEGFGFGEAECVEDKAFTSSAVGKAVSDHRYSHDPADQSAKALPTPASDAEEEGTILLAFSREDYLRLWPRRAKKVQVAAWAHRTVSFLQPFDQTDVVRIIAGSDATEERILRGQVVCRQGESSDSVRIIVSGVLSAARPVTVDKTIRDGVLRDCNLWLGPGQEIMEPQSRQRRSRSKHEELCEESSTDEELSSVEEAAAYGSIDQQIMSVNADVLDKSRAERAIHRVKGFAGFRKRRHVSREHDSREVEQHEVMIQVTRLERGSSFGFGQPETCNIVAHSDSVLLSLPKDRIAHLKVDPRLQANFVKSQQMIASIWTKQTSSCGAVVSAQLLGRIRAGQVAQPQNHLSGLDNEVPGVKMKQHTQELLHQSVLPTELALGLPKQIPKREHVRECARVCSTTEHQKGDENDSPLLATEQPLLLRALDMGPYTEKTYMDTPYTSHLSRLKRQYEDDDVRVLTYFEPLRHHHCAQVKRVLSRRKTPDVLPLGAMSALSFDPIVLQSKKEIMSDVKVGVMQKLSKLCALFNERRKRAERNRERLLVRRDLFLCLLRQTQLIPCRGASKGSIARLRAAGEVVEQEQALLIFDSHSVPIRHSVMQYVDGVGFENCLQKIAKELDVSMPCSLSAVSTEQHRRCGPSEDENQQEPGRPAADSDIRPDMDGLNVKGQGTRTESELLRENSVESVESIPHLDSFLVNEHLAATDENHLGKEGETYGDDRANTSSPSLLVELHGIHGIHGLKRAETAQKERERISGSTGIAEKCTAVQWNSGQKSISRTGPPDSIHSANRLRENNGNTEDKIGQVSTQQRPWTAIGRRSEQTSCIGHEISREKEICGYAPARPSSALPRSSPHKKYVSQFQEYHQARRTCKLSATRPKPGSAVSTQEQNVSIINAMLSSGEKCQVLRSSNSFLSISGSLHTSKLTLDGIEMPVEQRVTKGAFVANRPPLSLGDKMFSQGGFSHLEYRSPLIPEQRRRPKTAQGFRAKLDNRWDARSRPSIATVKNLRSSSVASNSSLQRALSSPSSFRALADGFSSRPFV